MSEQSEFWQSFNRHIDEYRGWSREVWVAAKAIYKRMRITHEEWPKWKDLDIDTIDHYCIAATNAIEAYLKVQMETLGK